MIFTLSTLQTSKKIWTISVDLDETPSHLVLQLEEMIHTVCLFRFFFSISIVAVFRTYLLSVLNTIDSSTIKSRRFYSIENAYLREE